MFVITATIGRNVKSTPMPDNKWRMFQADLYSDMCDALKVPAEAAWDVHNGIGIWEGETEPSHKLAVILDRLPAPEMTDDLKRRLSELARHYDQDAIALTIGQSELC